MDFIFSNNILTFLFLVPIMTIISGNIIAIITRDFSKVLNYIVYSFIFLTGIFVGLINAGINFDYHLYKMILLSSGIITFICSVLSLFLHKILD